MNAAVAANEVVLVSDVPFRLVGHPLYREAHPGEAHIADEVCTQCAIAERVDTGERYVLWLCGESNWSISRVDPRYEAWQR